MTLSPSAMKTQKRSFVELNGKSRLRIKPVCSPLKFVLRSFARQVVRHPNIPIPYRWGFLIPFHLRIQTRMGFSKPGLEVDDPKPKTKHRQDQRDYVRDQRPLLQGSRHTTGPPP